MESERKTRVSLRKKLLFSAGATVLTFSLASSANNSIAVGKASYEWTLYEGPLTLIVPSVTAGPIHNPNKNIDSKKEMNLTGEDKDNSPGGNLNITVLPLPVKNIEVFNQELNTEQNLQNSAVEILNNHPELFNKKAIEDFKMYYPIYKAVSDKYPNVDWFLLWINHEQETGASDSKVAFNGGTYPYFGGMQRNVNVWPQSYVDTAFKGLESLNAITTRNSTDAREIAAAAKMLSDNIKQYLSLGKNQAVLNSLKLFTGGDQLAKSRFDLWEKYKALFGTMS